MHILLDARSATADRPDLIRYCRELTENLAPLLSEDEQLTVLLSRFAPAPIVTHGRCHVRRVHHSRYSWWSRRAFVRLIKRTRPNIIWLPTPTHIPIHPRNVRTVLVNPDGPLDHWRFLRKYLHLGCIARIFRRRFLNKADAIICPTTALADELHSGKNDHLSGKVHIISNGISSTIRPASTAQIEVLRRRYCLPPKFLLAIQNPHDSRAIKTILNTIMRSQETDLLPLVILTDRSHLEALKDHITAYHLDGRVRPIPLTQRDDLPAFLTAATLFLEPSNSPIFPNTLLLAMACATPVIAASTPTNVEVGTDAIFRVHPTDPIEWRKAITQAILSSSWQEYFKRKGLDRASNLSWRSTAEQTLQLFRNIC